MKLPYIKLLQNLDLMLLVGRRGDGWYMVNVGWGFDAVMGSVETASVHSILDGRSHNDLLCSPHHTLQRFPLSWRAAHKPEGDGWSGHWWWEQEEERCGLLFRHRKCSCWAHLTRNNVLSDQSRLSVICTTETWYYWLPPLHCQWWMGNAWAGLCWSQCSSHLSS